MRRRPLGLVVVAVALASCGGAGAGSPTPVSAPLSSSVSASVGATAEIVDDLDVGGRTMHIVCLGPTDTGEPTILLEAGGGLDSSSWSGVMSAMQSQHRLCAYDRIGLGLSDPPREPSRTSADQVADLHALLDAAGVGGPFVVAAHSYGATVATLFTQAYPDEVVGLLFVDPQSPPVTAWWREVMPPPAPDEPSSITEFRDSLETFEKDPSQNPEHLFLRPGLAAATEALGAPGPLFGDRPVVVLSAGERPSSHLELPRKLGAKVDRLWSAAQQELADESTAGSRETVPGVGHMIPLERPEAVVRALEGILAKLGPT
jgi:pimeloyl-ACP methyl ester carboxylesterase